MSSNQDVSSSPKPFGGPVEEWIRQLDPYAEPIRKPSYAEALYDQVVAKPVVTPLGGTAGKSLYELQLQIPPLPQSLLSAIELTRQPDGPELEQVVAAVQKDPVVVARLLRIANSAYHGQRGEITNAHRAVIVLGPATVVGLIMSMSLMEVRAALDAATTVPYLDLVRHSIATAFLSQRLLLADPARTEEDPAEYVNEGFTAGVLHDFGKLILLYNFPRQAARFYTAPGGAPDLLEAERELFGYDHVETGCFLAQRLKFPASLSQVMGAHHRYHALEADEEGNRALIHAAAAGSVAAQAFGYSCNRGMDEVAFRQHPIWGQIVRNRILGYRREAQILETLESVRLDLAGYVDALC